MKNNLQGSAADDDEEDELKDDDEVEIIFLTAIIRLKAAARVLTVATKFTSHIQPTSSADDDDDDDFSITITINSIIRRRQAHCVRFTYTFIEKPHGAVDLIRGFIIALLLGVFHLASLVYTFLDPRSIEIRFWCASRALSTPWQLAVMEEEEAPSWNEELRGLNEIFLLLPSDLLTENLIKISSSLFSLFPSHPRHWIWLVQFSALLTITKGSRSFGC